jgi:hypothetical protein
VSQPPIRRTTARVVPVNAKGEALPTRSCDPATPDRTPWTAGALAADAGTDNDRLPGLVRAAVPHVRGAR